MTWPQPASPLYSSVRVYNSTTPSISITDLPTLRGYFSGTSYVELPNLRELPPFGIKSSYNSYDTFGERFGNTVLTQRDPPQWRLSCNYIPSLWAEGSFLRSAMANSDLKLMQIFLNAEGPRRNLLKYSEDLTNSVWTVASTITADATVAPDGTTTADLITVASAAANRKTQTITNWPSTVATFSYFAKSSGTATNTRLLIYNNTTTTSLGSLGPLITAGEDFGNGWYRHKLTVTTGITPGDTITAYIYGNNSNVVGTGHYAWGAQLEPSTVATAYQKVTSDLASAVCWYSFGFFTPGVIQAPLNDAATISLNWQSVTDFIGPDAL